MEIRLNMMDLKMNFKGMYDSTKCIGCFPHEDTTEHFLQYRLITKLTQLNIKTTNFEEEVKSTKWLIQMAKYMGVLQEVRTQRLQYR